MDDDFDSSFIMARGGGRPQTKRRPYPHVKRKDNDEQVQQQAESTQPKPGTSRKRPAKQQHSFKQNKRVRYNSTYPNTTTYSKSEEPKSTGIQMYAAQRTFTIYVGNKGIDLLSKVMFNAIQSRDHRMAQNMSRLQLKYVLTIAYANRVVQTSIHGGYALDIPAVSDLKRAAGSIQLPGLLVKYIEAIGIFKKMSGGTVAPFSGGPQQLFPPGNYQQISPNSILEEADRPIPNNPWCIDWQWIQEWNQATTRPSRLGMSFSNVESSAFEGRAEMLVSYRSSTDDMEPETTSTLQGVAPQIMSEAEGMLGACYGFRDYADQRTWLPGNKSLLFAEHLTTEFQPEQYLSDIIVTAFTM